ncbi:hypothetical protein BJX63DRAFT_382433 [Aspergillus granulosus]|uniref:Uncharacterized protein n=1 Tax=Aspergillus granulosus TaxID=176169 RepID=A0ABR4HUR2_9EURO
MSPSVSNKPWMLYDGYLVILNSSELFIGFYHSPEVIAEVSNRGIVPYFVGSRRHYRCA